MGEPRQQRGAAFHRLDTDEETSFSEEQEQRELLRTPTKLKFRTIDTDLSYVPADAGEGVDRWNGQGGHQPEELPLSGAERYIKAVSYGLMNMVVGVPAMIAFTSIIFRDPQFHDPHIFPQLVKLVLFSGFVHQVVFSASSSLTFAIGQVQDAGLIFLSAMATLVVNDTENFPEGTAFADRLPTVLISLSLGTAALGAALIVTGHLQLASYVQYLPLPVIGGYMAFIGLFCGEAGLSLMLPTGETIDGLFNVSRMVEQWTLLLTVDAAGHILPGVLLGLGLYWVVTTYRHYLVLPSAMLAIPLGFYCVVGIGGWSMTELRQEGWLANVTVQGDWYDTWELLDVSKMQWSILPSLFPTWLAMYFVVSFGSCLDVAAIQLDMGRRLNFNHELTTVGLSNLISGVTGGFTGS